jgi:NADH-quinone oxidoreductase subunit G
MVFSMEGDQNPPPAPLIPRFWWPGWNSNEAINKFQIEVGGSLHGGNPGKRLIEPGGSPIQLPSHGEPHAPGPEEVWLIPRPYIYGSEELSRLAAGVRELIPEPKAAMHPELANKLRLCDGHTAKIELDDGTLYLPVCIDERIAPDTVVVPLGFDETRGVVSPAIARVK